jgi:MFS family permease
VSSGSTTPVTSGSALPGSSPAVASSDPGQRNGKWNVLIAVLLGNFAGGFVFTLLSVARERIAEDLHTSSSVVLWAFTGPTLASAIAGPAWGRFGDLIGQKKLYVMSLIAGSISSVLVALSWNVGALIGFRTVSAMIGAAIAPSSLALIFKTFLPEERVKAMGYWSLVGAGAPVIGVLVGGPMVEAFGWRVLFWAQLPLYLLAIVMSRSITETERRAAEKFDFPGAVTLAMSALFLLFAVNRGPAWNWTDRRILGLFALSPIMLVVFVAIERRTKFPLLSLPLLRRRNVVAGIGAQVLAQFSYLGAGLFLVNDLLLDKHVGFKLGLAAASRTTIARPIAFSLVAPLAGYFAIRVGERITSTIGIGLVVVSMAIQTFSPVGRSLNLLILGMAVSGLGLGISWPSLGASVANAVPERSLGAIGGAQQLLVQAGGAIGTQVMVSLVASKHGPRTAAAYHRAFFVALVVAVFATALASLLRREQR